MLYSLSYYYTFVLFCVVLTFGVHVRQKSHVWQTSLPAEVFALIIILIPPLGPKIFHHFWVKLKLNLNSVLTSGTETFSFYYNLYAFIFTYLRNTTYDIQFSN